MPYERADPVNNLADEDSFAPKDEDVISRDPLSFPDYGATLDNARARSGATESVEAGPGRIRGRDVELALFRFDFIGGSMGEATGERIARALERAAERSVPLILRTATGGSRMQEGMRSLVQMAKVVAGRRRLARAGQPLIVVLGNPTTGGVLASIAALADVTVAESGATIGFAGPRVVQIFTGEPVPDGSHTATSAYAAGLVDDVVTASDIRTYVASVLEVLTPDAPREPESIPDLGEPPPDAWQAFQRARDATRPRAPDVFRQAADASVELRGDRQGHDDPALVASLARVYGRRIMCLALDRDHAPGPAAYRKARRCLAIAGRLNVPVVTLVDTRGADPSAGSESGGIAWEIGATFDAMLSCPSPTLALVTGEGGSGGALALSAADRLVCFDDAVFTVITPEAAAEILWRSPDRAEEAAVALRPTAPDLLDAGVIDAVASGYPSPAALGATIAHHLDVIDDVDAPDRSAAREARWRNR